MKARLLILGMLHRGPLHPYEMKRRLEAAMADCYLALDTGTFYYAIRQLETEGSIVATAQERVARGGMRTIYAISDEGRAAFRQGFFAQWEADGPVSETLYGALLFFHCVDQSRLIEAVRGRIDRLDGLIAKLAPLRETMLPALATGGAQLFGHIERQRLLDRDWLAGLLAELESGPIRDAPPLAEQRRPD